LVPAPNASAALDRCKPWVPADRASPGTARESHGPLDGAKARRFGDQLGADFSGVQIHSGDGVAEDHGAAAVAFGRDIHFADGMAAGGASDALLGHELVHTVQQGAAPMVHSLPLVCEIDAAITRALQRIAALRDGLDVWNNRATLYPKIWNPDGTLRGPIGPVSPLPPTPPDQDHPDGGTP
jgi:hypothetical protein